MFYRLRKSFERAGFNRQVRSILSTPPIPADDSPLRIVSMVSHQDLMMYLVAIKSFWRHLGRGTVTPLDDGSLTAEDKDLLRRHLPGMDLRDIREIDTGPCQRGGCWERLMLICNLARDHYVIQLDSDTITQGPMPEVEAQIEGNQSFTMLGGGSLERVETFRECTERTRAASSAPSDSDHVQRIVEYGMGDLAGREDMLYIRGNAAFAGFGRGSFDVESVVQYSELMSRICGPEKWTQWGSEQITSNLVVANSGGTFLPARRYAGYYPDRDLDYDRECILIHFIGMHRFENNAFARLAQRQIAQLPEFLEAAASRN